MIEELRARDKCGIAGVGKNLMEAAQATKRVDIESERATKRLEKDAHHRAISAPFPEVVGKLVSIIGRRLTAYIASVKDARAIDRWLNGVEPQPGVEFRLRLSYRVVLVLSSADAPAVVKNWLIGLNPELDDAVPIALLRDGDLALDGKKILGGRGDGIRYKGLRSCFRLA